MKYLFLFCLSFNLYAGTTSVTLESGGLWQTRNDIKIPGDTGTLVSFDEYDKGPFFHYRVEAHYQSDGPHGFRIIYAPLSLSVEGDESRAINFNEETFSANTPLTVDYKFNSYRIGYTYKLWGRRKSYFKLGITGKVRDAAVTFKQGSKSNTYDNIGFVPLLYYALKTNLTESWYLFSDADFAFSPQGRAADVTLKLRRRVAPNASVGLGYRALEGGADNDKVLTFTFVQYAVLDFIIAW